MAATTEAACADRLAAQPRVGEIGGSRPAAPPPRPPPDRRGRRRLEQRQARSRGRAARYRDRRGRNARREAPGRACPCRPAAGPSTRDDHGLRGVIRRPADRSPAPSPFISATKSGKAGVDRRAVVDARPARAPPCRAPGTPWRCGGRAGSRSCAPPARRAAGAVDDRDRRPRSRRATPQAASPRGDRRQPVALLDPQLGRGRASPCGPWRRRRRRRGSDIRRSCAARARPARRRRASGSPRTTRSATGSPPVIARVARARSRRPSRAASRRARCAAG